jgi:penicillin-binding protein 1C
LFNAGAVWSTVLALEEVIRPGSETGWEYLSSAKRIAWKTGTSYGFRDAWAVGITPDYVVAVWVGNADGVGRPGIVGTQAAAPIMFELFDILGSTSWFSAPYDDLAHVPMCTSSGMRASRYCHHVDSVFIPRTSLEAPTCSYHVKIHLDAERKHQVSMSCSDEIIDTTWFVLPVVPGWYYAKRNFSYAPPPPWLEGCDGYEKEQSLRILRPVNGTRMHTVRGLDGVLQDINLEAIHTRPEERLHWHIDAQYLGSTIGIHQMHCAVSVGKHTLIVLDEDGNQSISTFEVED